MTGARIRGGRDSDAEGFIRLIGECWADYPGCILDVDGELPELRALATYFGRDGGALWAAEQDGQVVGMAATRPMQQDAAWEICKVYVAKACRGTGLAHDLLGTAEAHARTGGAQRLVLWTDTRFEAAHRFYEKRGYVRQGSIRILDDISNSLEFRYAKPVAGLVVEALDAAAAASAERRLSDLLIACVASGASLTWLPPLVPAVAQAYWKQVSSQVALGKAVLLVAWLDGELVGTVQLGLDMPENAPHRAELSKLMVDPHCWRRGVGRALMRRAEQAARGIGRSLLVLDTRLGTAAEALYRELGWVEVGTIPGFELGPDRAPADAVFFWKAIR
ncbi:GNAT family N-acetyltransferase [Falsiroseomonas oryzae]|uniref:GNAT family N-acetyltransferase n=1 Tax=Falsiroseomonas oryzae TaxID=2766473 RepID=UPI0022EB674B|nr:GNAT family N-acetyltransferase [Roseomonas sp. MO-31]